MTVSLRHAAGGHGIDHGREPGHAAVDAAEAMSPDHTVCFAAGLPGSCGASAVLHAERLQGRTAGGRAGWQQPLPGAPILCFTLKTGE